ncbi:NADPH-dependent F420 reductase [Caballeronia sp. 15711]|uniref:NADPH-dependent F420 reductase n=1 Tax=Caballeronia sp. 15711 TaxID=3391029 RepID=UPI0039E4FEA0
MKIGLLGGGNFGNQLAEILTSAGHDVQVGLRDQRRAPAAATYRLGALAEAADHGEVVVIAVPYSSCEEVLTPLLPQLHGKIVVDATNPLNDDWSPRWLGQQNSAAEEVARLLAGTRLVKAFNTIFADAMKVAPPAGESRALTAFIAGNDEQANQVVAQLARDTGFSPVVTGALTNARYLEAMANLNIQIAVVHGGGTNAGFLYRQNL